MISDAFIIFTCDECCCEEKVTPPVVYSSMSGLDPHVDLRDSALEELLPRGWMRDKDKHYCEDCA